MHLRLNKDEPHNCKHQKLRMDATIKRARASGPPALRPGSPEAPGARRSGRGRCWLAPASIAAGRDGYRRSLLGVGPKSVGTRAKTAAASFRGSFSTLSSRPGKTDSIHHHLLEVIFGDCKRARIETSSFHKPPPLGGGGGIESVFRRPQAGGQEHGVAVDLARPPYIICKHIMRCMYVCMYIYIYI